MSKILVVDDAYFVRLSVRTFLESQGHQVSEAESGKQALTVYQEIKPDLVFCDITMPEMDGLEFLRNIFKADPLAKVVMLTSSREVSVLEEAKTLGAKDSLTKPFDKEKVRDILKKLLG